MKLNECPLPILALFLFLILIMPTACSQLTLQLMRMNEPYRVHIQGFSASFLQLFCLMIVQLTLLLAYLLLPMHMKNYFFLPLVLLPYSGSVCVLTFLFLSLCVSGNLSYSIHSIWAWLLPSVHMMVSLSAIAGTSKHCQSPFATTESCSLLVSFVASSCGHLTM